MQQVYTVTGEADVEIYNVVMLLLSITFTSRSYNCHTFQPLFIWELTRFTHHVKVNNGFLAYFGKKIQQGKSFDNSSHK